MKTIFDISVYMYVYACNNEGTTPLKARRIFEEGRPLQSFLAEKRTLALRFFKKDHFWFFPATFYKIVHEKF